MKKTFLILFGLVFLSTGSTVFAGDNIYLKLSAGISLFDDADAEYQGNEVGELTTDAGFSTSVAVGKNFGDFFLEGEYSYAKADLDELKVGGVTVDLDALPVSLYSSYKNLMVNAGYEFGTDTKPYVLAGIGMGWMNEMDGAEFAWQVGAGVTQPINKNLAGFVGYKYLKSADFEFDDFQDESLSHDSHKFEAGFKYSF